MSGPESGGDEDMSGDDSGDDSGGEGSDSSMKGLFATLKPAKYKAMSVKADIESVLKSARLSPAEKVKLRRALDTQDRLITESGAHTPSATKSLNSATAQAVAEAPKTDPVASQALKQLLGS